ncbi:cellulose biosynthesis protein BcsO [Serratia oryzae]|uniref:cellulose biosynthesis protein BcsO n=1 Tax=Serratia oryzae TaxID=2034155 RepID=UPI0018CD0C59|nr:cellulose biosynthesis protein BcsO [Serratia oryzae]
MSKYDDVQQFKKKINMKDIDYKEFPKEDSSLALHRWPIVEQVAEEGNGTFSSIERSMQPTPVSANEFSQLSSSSSHQPVQPRVATTPNQSLPGQASHDFRHRIPPVSVPDRDEQLAVPLAVTQPPTPVQAQDTQRFKKMFSKKTSSGEAGSVGRNALLKPLLEIIASCR